MTTYAVSHNNLCVDLFIEVLMDIVCMLNRTTKHEGSATDSLCSSGTYGTSRIGTQISYRRKALLASYRLNTIYTN